MNRTAALYRLCVLCMLCVLVFAWTASWAATPAAAAASPSSPWTMDMSSTAGGGNGNGTMCVDCMKGMSMPGCPDYDACYPPCVMNMMFSSDSNVCVLVDSWRVSTAAQWFLTGLVIFLFALVRELLLVWRQMRTRSHKLDERVRRAHAIATSASAFRQQQQQQQHVMHLNGDRSVDPKQATLLSKSFVSSTSSSPSSASGVSRGTASIFAYIGADDVASLAYDGLIYLLTVAFAYLLMLVVMTYSVALFFIVIFATGGSHVLTALLYTAWSRRATARANHQIREHQRSAAVAAATAASSIAAAGGTSAADGTTAGTSAALISSSSAAIGAPIAGASFASDPCCADIDFDDD